jgi:hypothetical protein
MEQQFFFHVLHNLSHFLSLLSRFLCKKNLCENSVQLLYTQCVTSNVKTIDIHLVTHFSNKLRNKPKFWVKGSLRCRIQMMNSDPDQEILFSIRPKNQTEKFIWDYFGKA